jgi:archaetidylinositol phosphate synthase
VIVLSSKALKDDRICKRREELLTRIKQKVQSLITSQAKFAYRLGFTPNRMSALGIFLSVIASLLYFYWQSVDYSLVYAPFLLLCSGYCDALDGIIARIHGQASHFGGFIDSLLDRYADSAILIGIILGGLCNPIWGLFALTGSLIVSYTRARAETESIKMETKGLAERAERLIIIAAGSFLEVFQSGILGWAIILLAILTNVTVLQRTSYFYKAIHEKKMLSS